IAGMAALASSSGPVVIRWGAAVARSVVTAPNGSARSAKVVSAPRKRVMTAARPELGNRCVRVRRSVRAWARGPPGNTMSRVMCAQACARRSAAPAGSGATTAPFRAPTELPTTRSAVTRCSASARSIPAWLAPRLPSPPRTKPTGRVSVPVTIRPPPPAPACSRIVARFRGQLPATAAWPRREGRSRALISARSEALRTQPESGSRSCVQGIDVAGVPGQCVVPADLLGGGQVLTGLSAVLAPHRLPGLRRRANPGVPPMDGQQGRFPQLGFLEGERERGGAVLRVPYADGNQATRGHGLFPDHQDLGRQPRRSAGRAAQFLAQGGRQHG